MRMNATRSRCRGRGVPGQRGADLVTGQGSPLRRGNGAVARARRAVRASATGRGGVRSCRHGRNFRNSTISSPRKRRCPETERRPTVTEGGRAGRGGAYAVDPPQRPAFPGRLAPLWVPSTLSFKREDGCCSKLPGSLRQAVRADRVCSGVSGHDRACLRERSNFPCSPR